MTEQILSEDEHRIVVMLGQAASAFIGLPEHHPYEDIEDFVRLTHRLQEKVMARAAIRAYPEQYTAMVGGLGRRARQAPMAVFPILDRLDSPPSTDPGRIDLIEEGLRDRQALRDSRASSD